MWGEGELGGVKMVDRVGVKKGERGWRIDKICKN